MLCKSMSFLYLDFNMLFYLNMLDILNLLIFDFRTMIEKENKIITLQSRLEWHTKFGEKKETEVLYVFIFNSNKLNLAA